MTELTLDQLAIVSGGESTTVTTPVGSYEHRTSNYESCLANVQRQANDAHPDTRWAVQRWLGLGTDANGPARAGYLRDNLRPQCGLPPAN